MKKGFIHVFIVSGENESCSFHPPVRDKSNKIVPDEKLFRIVYGYNTKMTTSLTICDDCWIKLKNNFDNAIEVDFSDVYDIY